MNLLYPEPVLVKGRNCWRLKSSKHVAFLIDAASYYAAFAEAVSRAKRSVLIVGWDIDSRVSLIRDDRNSSLPTQLGDLLKAVVSNRRHLHVHILNWDFAMIFAFERELFPVFKFQHKNHRRVHFQLDSKHPPGACHHQKVVVIDDAVAFVGGIDLTKRRWDTPRHEPKDPMRVDPRGEQYGPFHDVQLVLDGDAASCLGDLARERWYRATGRRLHPPDATDADPWPESVSPAIRNVEVGIARTEAPYEGRPGLREVETLYRDMISTARKFIYIENQYLTAGSVGEVLGEKLRQEEGPEIVMVLPRKSSGWLEQSTMDIARAKLLLYLQEQDRFQRLRAYYPVLPEAGDDEIHIHAKIMIVDDVVVRVGSSNLSNRSMGVDSECDVAIEAKGDSNVSAGIGRFRNQLMGEHLGVSAEKVSEVFRAQGSLISTLEKLRDSPRTLKPLSVNLPDWGDTVNFAGVMFDPEKPLAAEKLIEQFVPKEDRSSGRKCLWRGSVFLLVLVALAGAWRWTPMGDILEPATIVAWGQQVKQHAAAPLFVVGTYIVSSMAMVPITLVIIVTAFLFGPVAGFLYAFTGCLLGGLSGYGLGHLLGRNAVRTLGGSRLNRLSRSLAKHGVIAVIAVRVVPLAPFTIVNLAAGASHIRFLDFLFGTMLGMAPGIFLITIFGHGLQGAIRHPDWKSFVLPGAMALALALGITAARKWLFKEDRAPTHKNRDGLDS